MTGFRPSRNGWREGPHSIEFVNMTKNRGKDIGDRPLPVIQNERSQNEGRNDDQRRKRDQEGVPERTVVVCGGTGRHALWDGVCLPAHLARLDPRPFRRSPGFARVSVGGDISTSAAFGSLPSGPKLDHQDRGGPL